MMKHSVLLLFVLQCSLSFKIAPRAGCNIDISQLDPEPIVVSSSTLQFLYAAPDSSSISLKLDETVLISCPGGELSEGAVSLGTTIEASCQGGTQFNTNNGKNINFNDLKCSKKPFHTARYTGESCEDDGKEIEVGFALDTSHFVRLITICFDDVNLISLYSMYDLTRSIGHHESGVARPYFIEDDFYDLGVSVNDLYVRNGQRATINGLLGLPVDSKKYIQDGSDYYLARGHLTAKADFVYAPQQTATFHYVNAAPQWQTFNGANWNVAEGDVRDYAEANGFNLKVFTGTYGVATLPHEVTGEEVQLYLYADENGNRAIPVPEVYWKVLYNPDTKQGIALVGVNNPYLQEVEKSIICDDISTTINWLHWSSNDLKAGYSYACTVDDLRKVVPYLPPFDVEGLLL